MTIQYMNVWRSTTGHQWTGGEHSLGDRAFVDAVADSVTSKTDIRRVGVLRIRMKGAE